MNVRAESGLLGNVPDSTDLMSARLRKETRRFGMQSTLAVEEYTVSLRHDNQEFNSIDRFQYCCVTYLKH